MDAEELAERRGTRFSDAGRGHAPAAVDEDPFVRLTDADFARLRDDPSELAEELRFGSFWLAHSPAVGGRAQGRALEVAAEVIEALPLARRAAEDAQREAAKAIRLADAALKATKQAAAAAQAKAEHTKTDAARAHAAPSGAAGPPASRGDDGVGAPLPLTGSADPVSVIRAHLDAYVDYISRLERYVEDLRDLLSAHGGSHDVVAGPAPDGDDELPSTVAPLHLIVGAATPPGGTGTR